MIIFDYFSQLLEQRKREIINDLSQMNIVMENVHNISGICDSLTCDVTDQEAKIMVNETQFACPDKLLINVDRINFPKWTFMMEIKPVPTRVRSLPHVDILQALRTPGIGKMTLQASDYSIKVKTKFLDFSMVEGNISLYLNGGEVVQQVTNIVIRIMPNKPPRLRLDFIC